MTFLRFETGFLIPTEALLAKNRNKNQLKVNRPQMNTLILELTQKGIDD